jgi:hypothetical protein
VTTLTLERGCTNLRPCKAAVAVGAARLGYAFLFIARVCAAFLAAARRLLVRAAFAPARRRFRVSAALRAASERLSAVVFPAIGKPSQKVKF